MGRAAVQLERQRGRAAPDRQRRIDRRLVLPPLVRQLHRRRQPGGDAGRLRSVLHHRAWQRLAPPGCGTADLRLLRREAIQGRTVAEPRAAGEALRRSVGGVQRPRLLGELAAPRPDALRRRDHGPHGHEPVLHGRCAGDLPDDRGACTANGDDADGSDVELQERPAPPHAVQGVRRVSAAVWLQRQRHVPGGSAAAERWSVSVDHRGLRGDQRRNPADARPRSLLGRQRDGDGGSAEAVRDGRRPQQAARHARRQGALLGRQKARASVDGYL